MTAPVGPRSATRRLYGARTTHCAGDLPGNMLEKEECCEHILWTMNVWSPDAKVGDAPALDAGESGGRCGRRTTPRQNSCYHLTSDTAKHCG